MRIWIDGYEANQKNRVGSGQFAFEVIRNLEKIDQEDEYTMLLPSEVLPDMPRPRNNWQYKILKPNKLWTRIALPLALYSARIKPDLIFSPTHYIPRFSPVKRVVSIFDLAYLHFPEMFNQKDLYQLKNWTKFSIENADHIVTISEFTKEDIIENYNVDSKKITLAYPGYDGEKFRVQGIGFREQEVKKKYGIKEEYIIALGTIQPRKNYIRLIEAFKNVILSETKNLSRMREGTETSSEILHSVQDDNLKLVIVGKTTGAGREGWKFQETLDAPKRLVIEDKVIFTGFAVSEDLPSLLLGAKAFVLPSLWEGFGIPVLEAMASGTPVIVSNVSSLPEVAGEAGTYFDPYSVGDIAEKIEEILNDEKLRKKKIELGLKRVQDFSWEKCATEILKVFQELK